MIKVNQEDAKNVQRAKRKRASRVWHGKLLLHQYQNKKDVAYVHALQRKGNQALVGVIFENSRVAKNAITAKVRKSVHRPS